jgi:RNase H-like domain found in reverse transcriptase
MFDEFKLSDAARVAFHTVKELLENSAELVLMNEKDPLILYTDVSTNAIGGVLMKFKMESKDHAVSYPTPYRIKRLDGGLWNWSYSLWSIVLSS